jgi:hypothetical protein
MATAGIHHQFAPCQRAALDREMDLRILRVRDA